ncbi:MAG: GNAT family N-acetyltransferase [Rhodospirillales bacterium]|nr:GNAT family N-acetyltransferase [Rhodospirillales bacterium]
MVEPIVVVTDSPERRSLEVIAKGLGDFNDETTGISDRRPLAVVVQDPMTGETLGGVTGRTSLGLLFLDVFYLPRQLRGTGLGSQILAMAEEEGRKRGCRAAVLYTISFQAPGFYQRHGWRIFGEIPCSPPGTSRIFMTKDLLPDPAPR